MALTALAIAAIGVGVASISADVLHTSSNTKRKRRGTSDYEATPIQRGYGGVNNINPIKGINPINNLKGINNNVLNSIHPIRPVVDPFTPRTVYKNPEFNEFTDPLQVNSIGDVLFNQEGRDIIMEDLGLDWVDKVPILGSIAETIIVGVDMVVDKYAKPILNGEFSKAFITGLNGLGEDLDTIDLANTVKGFFLEKDSSKAFNRSLGFGNEGKYNYNFDTGDGVQDFLLEVVSSPGTWITVVKGAISSGIKGMAKTAIKESAERLARETGADITSEAMQSLIKRSTRIAVNTALDSDAANKLVKELMSDYVSRSVNSASVNFSKQFTKEFSKNMADVAGSKLVTALRVVKPLDEVNDALSMIALKTYLSGGTYKILEKTMDPIIARLKTVTLNGLQKITKKGVDIFKTNLPTEDAILDLTKVMDNATVKEIARDQLKNVKLGRLKYGDALDFLKVFGEPEAFDGRLTGMVRSIKDAEDPEEIFSRLLDMFEKDGVNTDMMRNSVEFKDFVIGTDTGSGYVLKTASALETVNDALNKNFKFLRRDILNELSGSKTNMEAFVKLDNYFKGQGISLEEMWTKLNPFVEDVGGDFTFHLEQKKFINDLLDELGFSPEWFSKDSIVIERAAALIKGNTPEEILDTVIKETTGYTARGNDLMSTADALWSAQSGIYKILRGDGWYTETFIKMLGDQSLSTYERKALEQIMLALKSETPMNNLLELMEVLHTTELRNSEVYEVLEKMVLDIQQHLDMAVDSMRGLEEVYAAPTSEYARNPFKDIDNEDFTPDGIYERLKQVQLKVKALAVEDLETAEYLKKLSTQPQLIKVFDNPIKPIELGKSLDRITFKNSDNFIADLKKRGVAKSIIENIPNKKLNEILLNINTVDGNLTAFESIKDDLMELLSSEDAINDLLEQAFKEDSISNISDIVESMYPILDFYDKASVVDNHFVIKAKDLPAFMDSVEELSNKLSVAIRTRSYKLELGEILDNRLYNKLESIQSKLQDVYRPLIEHVRLTGDAGKVYKLKLLQFFNRVENINKLRDTVYQGMSTLDVVVDIAEGKQTIIGGVIEALATGKATDVISNDYKTMAIQIQRKAQSTVNYLKLQEAVYDLKTTHGLNDAVMDYIENFSRKAASDVNITKEELEAALFARTELGKATGAMKLENYYNEYVAGEYEDVLRAHNAIDDRTMQIRVLQHQLETGKAIIPEGKTFVAFDLETTGLSIKAAELGDADIGQLSAARYQVQNGKIVQVGEPLNIYGRPRRVLTPDVEKVWGSDTVAKAFASDKTTIDVVKEFKEYVGKDAISGHNISGFDLPYLKAVSGYDNIDVIDTYKIMRDTQFKNSLYSEANIDKFNKYVEDSYNIITEYTAKQVKINQQFVYTIDKTLADDLYNLFNPLSDQLQTMNKEGLNIISSARLEDARSYILGKAESGVDYNRTMLPEGTNTFDTMKDGTSMIDTLRQGLTDTKNTNKELANWYITSDALEKEFGTTNIVAVMHGMQEGRYVDDFILNKFSVQTLWKPNHVNILNKMPKKINAVSAIQLEKFRTHLDRVYEKIFNNFTGYSKDQLDTMRRFILEDYPNSVWLKYTDLNKLSMYEMWALYQVLGYYNIVDGVIVKAANYEAARGLISNARISETNRKAISYIDDVQKLQKSYDTLIEPTSTNKEIDDAISDILANGDDTDTYRMIAYMERDYTTFVKDADTFDQDWYANIIRNDFETHYTVMTDMRRLADAKKNINPLVYYQYQRLNKQRFINHTKSVLGLTPESLTKYMHERGFVNYIQGADLGVFKDDIQHIIDNKKLYEAAGVSFKEKEGMFILYLNKNYETMYDEITKNVVYSTTYHGAVDKTVLDESMLNHLSALEKSDLRIKELNKSPFDVYNSVYNRIDGKVHRELIDNIALPDLVSEAYKNDFYGRVYQIDFPVLGSAESIRAAHPYAVTDMVSAQIKELNMSLKLSGARNKYIQFLFNDDYTLKRNALWDKLSDEQILNILKDNKKLSVVVLHEKGGKVMARKLNPTNLDHISSIRNLNGSIFPADMANKVVGTINEYGKILKENHPILYKWREYVVSTYKTLYLTSLGFLFRNGLDIITKNTATLGSGPLDIPNVIKYNMQAWKLWDNYSKTVADILKTNDGSLTEIAIDKFFKANPELDYRMFEFVHRYATSSASAGMAKAQQDIVKGFNFNKHSIETNVYKHALFENQIVKTLMSANSHIEHSGRLGLLLQSIEEGRLYDDAIQDVLRTHFDYSNLSYAEMLAETFIPFVTFPIRNLDYWADTIKGNMWLIELMLDATTETNQMHSQTQFMIDNSKALQNSLSNGNVRVLNSIIKTSPSAFDAARLVLQPADIIADYSESDFNRRVIAPLRVPRQKDLYGNVNTIDTKTKEYLRNVTAIYQVERPLGVAGNILGINDGNVDNIADLLPSIASEKKDKLGNMTGDMRMYQYLPYGYTLQSIVGAGFRRDAAGERIIQKVTPPKPKVSTRAGYSKQRIPYTKRYYSNSYNYYNRWKAQSYMRKNAMRNLPPTPESLENTIRNVFFMNNLTPLKMNYLQYKQRNQFR